MIVDLQTLPGHYVQAFCEGLEEVLKPYRRDLIKLEEHVLIGPDVTLVYIFSRVDKYSSLFMLLTSFVKQVSKQFQIFVLPAMTFRNRPKLDVLFTFQLQMTF